MAVEHFVAIQLHVLVAFVILLKPPSAAQNSPQWHLMHQADYDVLLHRVEVNAMNSSYFKDFRGGYVLYNRTQRVFNYNGTLLRDIKQIKLLVQAYKFASNEYRFFPLTVTLDICREYSMNSFTMKDILDKTSNFRGCPLLKGKFYVKHAIVDYSKFPPHIPQGDYKMINIIKEENYLIGEFHVYGRVQKKFVY